MTDTAAPTQAAQSVFVPSTFRGYWMEIDLTQQDQVRCTSATPLMEAAFDTLMAQHPYPGVLRAIRDGKMEHNEFFRDGLAEMACTLIQRHIGAMPAKLRTWETVNRSLQLPIMDDLLIRLPTGRCMDLPFINAGSLLTTLIKEANNPAYVHPLTKLQ